MKRNKKNQENQQRGEQQYFLNNREGRQSQPWIMIEGILSTLTEQQQQQPFCAVAVTATNLSKRKK